MCRKQIMNQAEMIFTKDELSRMVFYEYQKKEYIRVDVHGLNCSEAKRFLKNIINLVRDAFELIIIHGYSRGTAIKEMIYNYLADMDRIQAIEPEGWNPGVTHLLVA